jgi:uncharacterized protein
LYLLDANVLLPLLWPPHQHHARALEWFTRRSHAGWATCPFTQAASIRLLSNPRISPDAFTPANAEALLSRNLAHPHHHFWPDTLSVPEAIAPLRSKVVGHRQITDAYLLGLAIFRKEKLATFDHAITSLVPENVIPAPLLSCFSRRHTKHPSFDPAHRTVLSLALLVQVFGARQQHYQYQAAEHYAFLDMGRFLV